MGALGVGLPEFAHQGLSKIFDRFSGGTCRARQDQYINRAPVPISLRKGFVMTATKLIVILGILSAAAAANTFVVAPNAQGTLPGTFPGIQGGTNANIRRQQVIGPDQFQSNPILINQIAFRAFPGTGAVNATISSLNLYLSTSPNFPNTSGGKTL